VNRSHDYEWTRDDSTTFRLRAACDARAYGAVGDDTAVPPMSGSHHAYGAPPPARRRRLWIGVVTAVIVAAAGTLTAVVVTHGHSSHPKAAARHTTLGGPTGPAAPTSPVVHSAPGGPPPKTVRVTSALNDGDKVGIGEPIVLNFSPSPTDSTAFTKAVTVTVDGQPADGAWYWEKPYADQPIQAHYRERGYWPANATIKVKLPIGGRSAGKDLAYAGALNSVTFTTGDAHVSTVDYASKELTVTSNGKVVNRFPVSLGAAATPTYNGIKVVMQKGEDAPGSDALRPNGTVMMSGPGYSNDPVPWSVRITASGEYVHAAGWNTNIGVRDTSNGCTNLKPADGKWFYDFSLLGDVVQYSNTDGTALNPLDGLGDWNIGWPQWTQGGQLLNH
jgi:lipoprotein-anchoring transpeptidase ErfK/SrfK